MFVSDVNDQNSLLSSYKGINANYRQAVRWQQVGARVLLGLRTLNASEQINGNKKTSKL